MMKQVCGVALKASHLKKLNDGRNSCSSPVSNIFDFVRRWTRFNGFARAPQTEGRLAQLQSQCVRDSKSRTESCMQGAHVRAKCSNPKFARDHAANLHHQHKIRCKNSAVTKPQRLSPMCKPLPPLARLVLLAAFWWVGCRKGGLIDEENVCTVAAPQIGGASVAL